MVVFCYFNQLDPISSATHCIPIPLQGAYLGETFSGCAVFQLNDHTNRISVFECPMIGLPQLDATLLSGDPCFAPTEVENITKIATTNDTASSTSTSTPAAEEESVWIVHFEKGSPTVELPMISQGGGNYTLDVHVTTFFFNFSDTKLYGQVVL